MLIVLRLWTFIFIGYYTTVEQVKGLTLNSFTVHVGIQYSHQEKIIAVRWPKTVKVIWQLAVRRQNGSWKPAVKRNKNHAAHLSSPISILNCPTFNKKQPQGKRGFLTLTAPIATKVVCFSHLLKCLKSLYGSVDPDQLLS